MRFRRLPLLVASLLLGLVVAPAVHAKEGVRATLIGPIDLHALPGERIMIAWKLEDTRGLRSGPAACSSACAAPRAGGRRRP